MNTKKTHFYVFGDFRFDPRAKILTYNGGIVPLPHKALETLAALLTRRGEVVSKDELLGEIWKDVVVEEGNLSVHIHTLRKTLAKLDPGGEPYIQTVKRYGFRFAAEACEMAADYSNSVFGGRGVLKKIAVLPFRDSQHNGDEFLSRGIADALVVKLKNTGKLVVRLLGAAAADLDEKSAKTIGREHAVEAVLSGSLQRIDDKLRVVVQLVEVRNGTTVWAEQFDERIADIFQLEDSISRRVVEALKLQLNQDEQRRLLKNYTENSEAHLDYLKGRFFWNKRAPDAILSAIKYFERAIEKDSDYAPAYVGLADSYNHLGHHGAVSPGEIRPKMKVALIKAIELDEARAETHASFGAVLMDYEWDWAGSEKAFRRAIELDANYASAHHWYAELLTITGRHEAAVAEIKLARSLDPVSFAINSEVGRRLFYEREYRAAIEELKEALELDANYFWTNLYLMQAFAAVGNYREAVAMCENAPGISAKNSLMSATLGYVYALAGETVRARRILAELNETARRQYVSPTYLAFVHIALGETNVALELLERARRRHDDPHLQNLRVYPQLDDLRAESRFQEILRKMNLD